MANKFWLGGTGNWDGTTGSSANWGTASGGGTTPTAGPGVNDVAIFDGASGGGTVTVTGTITVQQITMGAFTGTLDFSANDNNATCSVAVSITGSATRTLNMGDGTWTLSNASNNVTIWDASTVTGLTLNANSSTIAITGTANLRNFSGGGKTYNALTIAAATANSLLAFTGANTFASFSITPPVALTFAGVITTITNAFTWSGTSSAPISITSNSGTSQATISTATGAPTMDWAALRGMIFQGGATFTATNSLDLKGNSGITITAPGSAGGFPVLGGPFT